ncbi:hypothetical protein V491_02743, partial [Pseudogymnoascus sp. VKM F-3775]
MADTGAQTYNLHTCEDANWCCSPDGDKCCSLKHIRLNPRDVLRLATSTASTASTATGGAAVVTETETKTVKVDAAGQTTAVSGASATTEECPRDK